MIAALILLYSVGKQMHLSSLLIVLVFGIILSNHKLFTSGKLSKYFVSEDIENTYSDFSTLKTLSLAFFNKDEKANSTVSADPDRDGDRTYLGPDCC